MMLEVETLEEPTTESEGYEGDLPKGDLQAEWDHRDNLKLVRRSSKQVSTEVIELYNSKEYKDFVEGSKRLCNKPIEKYGNATLATLACDKEHSEWVIRSEWAIREVESWLEQNDFRIYIPAIFHNTNRLYPLVTSSVMHLDNY